jgi:hypothetical protein
MQLEVTHQEPDKQHAHARHHAGHGHSGRKKNRRRALENLAQWPGSRSLPRRASSSLQPTPRRECEGRKEESEGKEGADGLRASAICRFRLGVERPFPWLARRAEGSIEDCSLLSARRRTFRGKSSTQCHCVIVPQEYCTWSCHRARRAGAKRGELELARGLVFGPGGAADPVG